MITDLLSPDHHVGAAMKSWVFLSIGCGLTIMGYIYFFIVLVTLIETISVKWPLLLSLVTSLIMIGVGEWLLITPP